jgi:hypothetical protein
MVHDTIAFVTTTISYLRKSMTNKTNKIIYDLLDAEDYYADASGNGNNYYYSKNKITEALSGAKEILKNNQYDKEDIEDIICFLERINYFIELNKLDGIEILFG